MDDLDDELFGSLLKSTITRSKPNTPVESKKPAADFDLDDDILSGLLPDSKDKPISSTGRTVKLSDKSNVDASSLTTPAPKSRQNVLDSLLAKSDIVVQRSQPKSQEFVLGDSYRSSGIKDLNVDRQEEVQFGGYVPTTARPTTADKKTARTASNNDPGQLSLTSRQGRRTNQELVEGKHLESTNLAAPLSGGQKHRITSDWLELKGDSEELDQKHDIFQVGSVTKTQDVTSHSGRLSELKHSVASASARNSNRSGVVNDGVQAGELAVANSTEQDGTFLSWLGVKSTVVDTQENATERLTSGNEVPVIKQNVETSSSLLLKESPLKDSLKTVAIPELVSDLSGFSVDYNKQLTVLKTQLADMHVKFCEESLSSAGVNLDLQTKVRRLEFERDQFKKSLEGLETRHKEELEAVESSFKKRVQLVEESYQRREHRLQEEVMSISQALTEKQKCWDRERSELITSWQQKLDAATRERIGDLERLKELHRQTVTDLRKDHEVAIERLQQIKKLEVDAMTEATSHARTLQLVIEQLQANTTELSQLQTKVDEGSVFGVEEMELLIKTKDCQLKSVQDQLLRQREQNEKERTHLHQVITRLEEKQQKQRLDHEEEHWKLSQERNTFQTERTLFEELKKSTSEQLEKDKAQLKKARESFLEEQKAALQHIYSQGHLSNFNAAADFINSSKNNGILESVHSLKTCVEVETALRSIEEERKRMEKQSIYLNSEKDSLEKERALLEREQSAINALAVKVKQRSEEIEDMCLAATQTREEGYTSLREARQLQMEVQHQREALVVHSEGLKKKEFRLAEERLSLAQRRKETERLAEEILCSRCRGSVTTTPTPNTQQLIQTTADPILMAWRISAKKDQEFLQQESLFLKELRGNRHTSGTLPL